MTYTRRSSYLEQKTPSNVCRTAHIRPAYTNDKKDINSELDELDREEFYRLKKVTRRNPRCRHHRLMFLFQVKNNKQRDNEIAERAEVEKKGKRRDSDKENDHGPEAKDVLGEQEDQDVIF